MTSLRQIAVEIASLNSYRELVQTYSEVAALRVQRLRHAVMCNRSFMAGLGGVYEALRATYRKEILTLMKREKFSNLGKLTLRQHNGRTAYVFLSANTGLYGDLIKRTYDLFKREVDVSAGDIFIVGRLGAALFREENPKTDFTYFDAPDDKIGKETLSSISKLLINYEKVLVFYGRFESVVSQRPYFSSLSGDFSEDSSKKLRAEVHYIFEPSLEKVVAFFESQIFSSLFIQAAYENLLAKFAARMLNLDAATERVKKRLNEVAVQQLRLKHRAANADQLDSLAGISLWGVAQ